MGKYEEEKILQQLEGDFCASQQTLTVPTTFPIIPIVKKNDKRHSVSICFSPATSTATIIYLGFENNVSASNFWMALRQGEWISIDDFKGEIFAIASGTNALVGIGEW